MERRRVAVVTGASAGVGRATAKLLAESGFDVALVARGIEGLAGAARDVESAGGRGLAIETDVSSFEEVEAAASETEAALGPIDVWINDAMTTVFAPSWDVRPADFQRAVEVTFLGQVWGTFAALKRMRPRDRGTIVNVGSALAFMGIPLQSAYCSSKFACRGFFESTRAELIHEHSNVRLSMVHLPAVNTPQFDWCETTLDNHPQPVPPIYQPELPAQCILDVVLDGRRAKVVGSWNKLLVLGGRLFPSFANQFAAIGAWETQLTDQHVAPDRPNNLYKPADHAIDHGAHGMFDDKAGGFFDPSFLVTLPKTAKTFVEAASRTLEERRRIYRRRVEFERGQKAAALGFGRGHVMSVAATSPRQPSFALGSVNRGAKGHPALAPRERGYVALRYLVLTGVLVGAAGIGGWWLSWPLLSSTIGPTAYVFAAHPNSESARFRNALIGHGVAIGVGLGVLAAFGLVHSPSVSAIGAPTLRQVGASAIAVGVTVLLLELLGSHHAPAAASALLVSTGLAKPGAPLIGLVLGLAVVLVLGPICGRWKFARPTAAREQVLTSTARVR